jgi:hypothetical protein
MNLKDRLQKLEEKTTPSQQNKIYVGMEGDDYVTCDGKEISLADFEKIKSNDEIKVLNVGYEKEE